MIETERVAGKIAKESGFRELVFSANEIRYCETRANKPEHYAARFAAKEAFFKALGTGWRDKMNINEVEILNDELGKPYIELSGETLQVFEQKGGGRIHISLSHIKETAVAFVIIESFLSLFSLSLAHAASGQVCGVPKTITGHGPQYMFRSHHMPGGFQPS